MGLVYGHHLASGLPKWYVSPFVVARVLVLTGMSSTPDTSRLEFAELEHSPSQNSVRRLLQHVCPGQWHYRIQHLPSRY